MASAAGHGRRPEASRPEIADVLRRYGDRLPELSRHHARTVHALTTCRTAALGGHVQECDQCGLRRISYNSCRNRHCPKCQGLDEVRWVERQQLLLLPVEYHHVVFTVPQELHLLLRGNPRAGYGLVFEAVAETLQEVARRPSNLGARIGFTAVLHTWTQQIAYHPHVHCVVTGGGLSPDGSRWVSAKPRFLFFVGILARVFCGKLLHKLEMALGNGKLADTGEDGGGSAALRRAARKDWHVYSKPPFAGPEQVLRYLGRYTHRIAISNSRLVSVEHGEVTFRWRDRKNGNATRYLTLPVEEFQRRFLPHILPPGFMRIRHYGLIANGCRRRYLETCRHLLGVDAGCDRHGNDKQPETWQELLLRITGEDVTRCPRCHVGRMNVVLELKPLDGRGRSPPADHPP